MRTVIYRKRTGCVWAVMDCGAVLKTGKAHSVSAATQAAKQARQTLRTLNQEFLALRDQSRSEHNSDAGQRRYWGNIEPARRIGRLIPKR